MGTAGHFICAVTLVRGLIEGWRKSMGKVVIFSEADYQYGVGPLRLRVDRIDRVNPVYYENENWYTVEGVQISGSGTELQPRRVLVRGRRL